MCRNLWKRWTKCNRRCLSTLRCCSLSHYNLCIYCAQKKEFPLSGTHQRNTRVYFRFMNSRRECKRSFVYASLLPGPFERWRYMVQITSLFFRGKTVRLGYIYCRERCACESPKKDQTHFHIHLYITKPWRIKMCQKLRKEIESEN